MSTKQARLVAAIADAMEAQGISQNTLGRKSGVAQSMISAAILGKYDLKEEKWRLLCEALGLDYDQIVEGPELPPSSPDGESITPSVSASAASSLEEGAFTRKGASDPSITNLGREDATVTSEETEGGGRTFPLVKTWKTLTSTKRSGICFVSPPVTLPAI